MVEDMSDFEANYRSWHTKISYFKSSIRLFTCFASILADGDVIILAAGFGLAEILGIVEEYV